MPDDPCAIAIVGIGCRLPGDSNSPDSFWKLLTGARDAISELPKDRWSDYSNLPHGRAALARVTKLGGFVGDIDGFDASFFGISPREAALMDPQQRMALEVCWEALEHAGIDPTSLAGTDAGVYIGVNSDDHGRRLLEDLPRIEAWTGIGSSLCGIPNRVSHALDLRGPSMAVDTACSASLVALHLACQALRLGETGVALAGGVMLMAGPALTMVMDAAGALAPDGRSKAFDADADGYGRGEGCGILVLRRLADAQADGDPVLAVIRGSSVHQDGRTNGIMAPSQDAQAELMRLACAAAGVTPAAVGYVEAHGTGTLAGDPVEAGAIGAVYGAGRPAGQPCLIGSVKTNIGHLEAASGVAGVIKVVLALRHGQLPPSLNFHTPNPAIDWSAAGLRVVAEPVSWPRGGQPRLAAVSGYGYGGTIAHLILAEAPAQEPRPLPGGKPRARIYPLSAVTEDGIRGQAARLAGWLMADGAAVPLDDVACTLTRRRPHLSRRAAVVATGRQELAARLLSLAAGEPAAGLTSDVPLIAGTPGAAWVFSGHGSHWTGMGRELLDTEPAFGAVLDQLAPVFTAELGLDPRWALTVGELRGTDQIQPMTFAMQVALAQVWRERGLRPAAVIGHSVGEFAAAVTAGALSLTDAARLTCRRSALLRRVAGQGAMFMVNLPYDETAERLAGQGAVVAAIAASPSSTVISGEAAAATAVAGQWAAAGLRVRRVDSDVAFHSPLVEPLLGELAEAARQIAPGTAQLRTYTTVLADPREVPRYDGSYWVRNLRDPVRFAQAVRAAADDGYRVFVEVSAHPVVTYSITEVLADAGIEDTVIACTLRRDQPEQATMQENLAQLACAGVPVDWARAQPDGALAELPARAWHHRAYRPQPAPQQNPARHGHDPRGNSLLGELTTVHGPAPTRVWRTFVDFASRPYPGTHPVRKVEIVPAAVLLTTFFAAAGEIDQATGETVPGALLADVQLRVPVAINESREVQVVRTAGTIRLNSRLLSDPTVGWQTHTLAVVPQPDPDAAGLGGHLDDVPARCSRQLDPEHVAGALADVGVAAMGFPWQVRSLARGDNEMFAWVRTDPDEGPGTWAPVLDAALSASAVAFGELPALRMPASIRKVAITGPPPAEVLIDIKVRDAVTVDVDIATLDGRIVGRFSELAFGEVDGRVPAATRTRQLVHQIAWRSAHLAAGPPPGVVVLVGDGQQTDELSRFFAGHGPGSSCLVAREPEQLNEMLPRLGGNTAVIVVAGGRPASAAWQLVRTAQVLSRWPARKRLGLWSLTSGVRETATAGGLAQSPVWGVGRVLGTEHPDLWRAVIDLPDGGIAADLAGPLTQVLCSRPADGVLAVTPGGVFAARLVSLTDEVTRTGGAGGQSGAGQSGAGLCRPDGTYLITGGLGALGLQVARWLATRGARRLVLAGRRSLPKRPLWDALTGADADRVATIRELEAAGVSVTPMALDVTDRAEAARRLDPGELGMPAIRGIVHAAGVLDSRLAAEVDEASMIRVMQPKVAGAQVLHELFPPGSLDFFALFSSAGPLLGLPGQASYAAANSYLDALARHRRAAGSHDTIALSWTSWRGLGMSTSAAVIDAELAARGTAAITADEAFQSWEYAWQRDTAHVAVFRTTAMPPGTDCPPLLAELAVPADQAPEPEPEPVQVTWDGLTGAELEEKLTSEVQREIAAEMHMTAADLDVRRPLAEMGLDSVLTQMVRLRLTRRFRVQLPVTLLWERPTVAAVAGLLAEVVARPADGNGNGNGAGAEQEDLFAPLVAG